MTGAKDFFDWDAAPMRIASVRLRVRDLDAVATYYKNVLGLTEVSSSSREVVLGNGGTPLVELLGNADLAPNDRHQAGLFHTAFLMPTRADLARWLRHTMNQGIRLQGASDHSVSEALYISDPEGNGIEVYADWPVSRWLDAGGNIQMSTDPLDLEELLGAAGTSTWSGFPPHGTIGHVHLRVGDIDSADRFYCGILGLESTVEYPGASFYGSGGYHHQLAGNVWNSRGASRRPINSAGLDRVGIRVRESATIAEVVTKAEAAGFEALSGRDGTTLCDPWGTTLSLAS